MAVDPNEINKQELPPVKSPKQSLWADLRDFIADQDEKGRQEVKWSVALVLGILVGIVLIGLFSVYSPPSRGHVLAISLLSAGAALAMGLLVGFLFGIPRAVQTENPAPPPTPNPASPPTSKFKANTNLEQISDWLTKIIVGVGLVQLPTIPAKLRSLAGYFATAYGVTASGEPVAHGALVLAVLGYFGIFGFLLGYLWARIYLMKVFSE